MIKTLYVKFGLMCDFEDVSVGHYGLMLITSLGFLVGLFVWTLK